jgi:MFS transporter, putative metabolite:H+ symporter
MYSEFLPVDKRGVYLIYFEVFWTVGALLGAGIAWSAASPSQAARGHAMRLRRAEGARRGTLPTLGWRWMVGLAALPPLIPLACYYWLPESPRHMLLVGRTAEARALVPCDTAAGLHAHMAQRYYVCVCVCVLRAVCGGCA